jgi:hypothetical protein
VRRSLPCRRNKCLKRRIFMRTDPLGKSKNSNRSPDLVYLELPAMLVVIFAMLFVMSAGSRTATAAPKSNSNLSPIVQIEEASRTTVSAMPVASRNNLAYNSRATSF